MKKTLIALIILSLLCILPSCKLLAVQYGPSSLSEVLAEELLENHILFNGIKSEYGYFSINSTEKTAGFYDLVGKLIWEKEFHFDYLPEQGHIAYRILPLKEGGFIISASCAHYQKQDGSWVRINPIIAKCDKDGNIKWQYEYKGFSDSTINKIFVLPNGDIITAGYTRNPKEKFDGTGLPNIYLSKLSKDGNLIAEKFYGGSDFDTLHNAEYIKGKGIIAPISTQSKDGCFSSAKDDYPRSDVLAFFNEDLELSWFKNIDEPVYSRMMVYNNRIYLMSYIKPRNKTRLRQYDLSGNHLKSVEIPHFSGMLTGYNSGIITQQDKKLIIYDRNLRVKNEIFFDAGATQKVVVYNDFLLVLSVQPSYMESRMKSEELIYSGYSFDGKLLWRKTFVITYGNSDPSPYF